MLSLQALVLGMYRMFPIQDAGKRKLSEWRGSVDVGTSASICHKGKIRHVHIEGWNVHTGNGLSPAVPGEGGVRLPVVSLEKVVFLSCHWVFRCGFCPMILDSSRKIVPINTSILTFDNFTRKFGALKLRSLVGYHLKIVLYMFCILYTCVSFQCGKWFFDQ